MKKYICLFFISIIAAASSAQVKSIGTPFVKNYKRAQYNGGQQTWMIEQGENGLMYFANNNGLLEFDGHNWVTYPLPNNSIVRAIKNGGHGILFAGGYDEIGYFELGSMGGAKYHSLTHLVPESERNFDEVWRIFVHGDGIIFQTFTHLLFYKDNRVEIIKASNRFHFSFMVNGEFYVDDIGKGLLRYAMGNLFPMVGMEPLIGKEIWAVQPLDHKLLIATASEGVFLYDGNSLEAWENESADYLLKNQTYSSLRLNERNIAFGTIQDGLLICDNSGAALQRISRKDGLQNNTILCLQKDRFGNLWLGTDHGIDFIEINSPLSQLSYNYGVSSGYAAHIYGDNMYVGTNQGLFVKDWVMLQRGGVGDKNLKIIEETRGQVWTLEVIDDVLFCGHHNGTFVINGSDISKITAIPGGWTYLKVPDDNLAVLGGTYSGLVLLKKTGGKWQFSNSVAGFNESSRSLLFDQDGSLWMAHGLKGVFHLWLNPSYDSVTRVEFFNSKNSPLPNFGMNLAKINNQIIFTSPQGLYQYDRKQHIFIPYTHFDTYLKNKNVSSLKEDKEGNIWYFSESRLAVLRVLEDGSYSNIDVPFRQLEGHFVNGFEFVYPIDEQNTLLGTENGFAHYNPSVNKNYSYPFNSYLMSMRTFYPDSVLHFDFQAQALPIILEYANNAVEFHFSANDFENDEQLVFSTFLEGYDLRWTDWQARYSREFTNLDEGKYTFSVKARNIYGTVSQPNMVHFEILPPWQRSTVAYGMYTLLTILFLILIGFILKKRFEYAKIKSSRRHQELYRKKEEALQREALEAEKQVIRMRNEKLREEMIVKDKELANATMHTLHKNELMINLKEELNKIASATTDKEYKYKLNHLVRKINKEIDNENQWKIFETHFENVHEAFLTRIKSTYPNLTPRELKLCAYLRMNISSKEISLLMNISTRGVEISRYRLRKKLQLKREENLTDFILSF